MGKYPTEDLHADMGIKKGRRCLFYFVLPMADAVLAITRYFTDAGYTVRISKDGSTACRGGYAREIEHRKGLPEGVKIMVSVRVVLLDN
jgi:hypothetical protein